MKRYPPFSSITASAATGSAGINMYPRPPVRARGWRSQGRREYSDVPPGLEVGVRPEFVSGDSHYHSVQDANRSFRSLNSLCQPSYCTVHPPPQNLNQHFYWPSPQKRETPAWQQFPSRGPYADENPQPYMPPSRVSGRPFGNINEFKGQEGHQPYRSRPSKPPDYRAWDYAKPGPPPHCERFTVLSYNILADYLALDHWQLYSHIPRYILDWSWRKRSISFELGLWSADILCFQEVDRFQDIEAELMRRGYSGIWKMRTGNAIDGCATFWHVSRFKLLHEESIEYNKLGLRDNVVQICVLEFVSGQTTNSDLSAPSTGVEKSNRVVVCNVHVLFNPKRGDIKLGQIRVLLERAQAVSKLWDNAPLVICGDFNCTPKSPLYKFISEQKLDLSELPRDKVSGQASAETTYPSFSHHDFRAQSAHDPQVFVANPRKPDRADFSSGMSKSSYVYDSSNASPGTMSKCSVVDETSKSCISETLMAERANELPCHDAPDSCVGKGTSHEFVSLESGCEDIHHASMDDTHKNNEPADDNHDNLLANVPRESTSGDLVLDNKLESFALNDAVDETKDAEFCEDRDTFLSELHNNAHATVAADLSSDSHYQNLDSCSDKILNNFIDANHEVVIDRGRYSHVSSAWTPMEIQTATGRSDCNVMEHPLKLKSAYAEVQDPSGLRDSNGEPLVTSYHRRFLGTVDYIWISENLQVSKVLAPIPKHVMLQTPGFPTKKWGSDHIALVSELAFTKDEVSENATK